MMGRPPKDIFISYLTESDKIKGEGRRERPFQNRPKVLEAMSEEDGKEFNKLWDEHIELLKKVEEENNVKFPLEKSTLLSLLQDFESKAEELVAPLKEALEEHFADLPEEEKKKVINTFIRGYLFNIFMEVDLDPTYSNFHRIVRNSVLLNKDADVHENFLIEAVDAIHVKGNYALYSAYFNALRNVLGDEGFEEVFLRAIDETAHNTFKEDRNMFDQRINQMLLSYSREESTPEKKAYLDKVFSRLCELAYQIPNENRDQYIKVLLDSAGKYISYDPKLPLKVKNELKYQKMMLKKANKAEKAKIKMESEERRKAESEERKKIKSELKERGKLKKELEKSLKKQIKEKEEEPAKSKKGKEKESTKGKEKEKIKHKKEYEARFFVKKDREKKESQEARRVKRRSLPLSLMLNPPPRQGDKTSDKAKKGSLATSSGEFKKRDIIKRPGEK